MQEQFEIICDHCNDGQAACCPCGKYLYPKVKNVPTKINGETKWLKPYGENGIGLEESFRILKSEEKLLESAWNQQMITGEEYIKEMRKLKKGNKYIEKEKLI